MRSGILALVAVLLTVATSSLAQQRSVGNLGLQPQAQVEVALTGDDYIFGAFNLFRYTTPVEAPTFASGQLKLGYEHFAAPAWSWGATLEAQRANSSFLSTAEHYLTPEVFGRHWNTIGSVNFRQRLGVSYFWPLDQVDAGRLFTSLRLDVDRIFPLGSGGVAIRPRVAFEPIAYLRLQREDDEPKERVIDFTELRGEVGVRLSPRFDFTPWFAWRNSYFFSLPQLDVNGNVKIPGGRGRFVQPVLGLDMRITLGKSASSPERRQLPTQY